MLNVDGKMLPFVKVKPRNMPYETWEWLLSLPFGSLIFSTLGDGPPLPATCAAGDLDGDLYLVCWDRNIVSHVKPREKPKRTSSNCSSSRSSSSSSAVIASGTNAHRRRDPIQRDPNWFAKVQAYFMEDCIINDHQQIGKFYVQMQKIQDTSPLGWDDPDARILADAYLQALDRPKHGNEIVLPDHLRILFNKRSRVSSSSLAIDPIMFESHPV